jgi:hypothetical protein
MKKSALYEHYWNPGHKLRKFEKELLDLPEDKEVVIDSSKRGNGKIIIRKIRRR